VDGEITTELVEYLRKEYGDIELIEDEDEQLIEVSKSGWYRSMRKAITPGENLRVYRVLHKLTQEELGKKLGNFTRQNVSNMENGHRAISKNVALRLSELFDVSVDKFM